MTLCLYECLKAAGLQRHYARFTSVGVHRAAHLSGLTMEDYPVLGIRSMEDRTRLFNLVQMLKTVDLESLEDEDHDDYERDGVVVDSSINNDVCRHPDEDVSDDEDVKDAALNAASFSKPSCVRRRLDFSCEPIDHHQKLFSHPVGSESYNRHSEPGQGQGSAIPVQHDHDSVVVCGCKGSNNHKLEVHGHQSNHHIGANAKQDIMEELSINDSHTRFSTRFALSHKLKPRPATVASRKFSDQPVGRKDRKEISRKEMRTNIASEHTAKATPVYESKRAAGYNYGLPLSSPLTPNKKQPGAQRISVCVRKRPLTCTERRIGEADVVKTLSGECVIVHESKEAVDLTGYILQHRFYFDQVFGEQSSNEEVYRRTAYPLVQHMLNGGKATCFAYGQTGAGKTHTMLGSSPGRPGLYALAVRDIFAHLSTTHTRSPLLVYVSFFEIYCGQLYDLLDHRKRLFAREDGQKVVHIAGLRDVRVDSVSSLLEVISQGTEERTQGVSGVNPLSSRSHALLQIQLRSLNQQVAGRMWFVDLAGSERASDTKEPDRQSRMEGAEINQSLLAVINTHQAHTLTHTHTHTHTHTDFVHKGKDIFCRYGCCLCFLFSQLKECIRSLDQEQSHTPFRQSKLTQVLKDSFIGDSMTCMIANISPGHLATEHTLNTLRYADRVKELRGQGGLRGGRRGKTIPSPKRNLSNSNSSTGASSTGTRGKSPPKKPKLGRQREVFGPSTPTSRVATGGSILCSTPKNSRWGEETSARGGKEIGLEQITPIRGMLGTAEKREKREKACGRLGRRETYGGPDSAGHANGDQNIRAGLVLGQATDEQLHLWEPQRESVLYRTGKANQPSTLQGGREGERRSIERRTQVESSRDTYSEVERQRERDLQKDDRREKERERHLRQYHQQLQQFMPSSASSSFSSSNQASLSSSVSPSSCSPLRHSSHTSVSALMSEEALDLRRTRAEVKNDGNREQKLLSSPSAEICSQTKTSPSYNNNKGEVGHGDLSEVWRVSLEGTGSGFGQERGKREKRRSLKTTGEGVVRDRRPAGVGGGGERRWAWVVTTETEQTGRRTGATTADLEALRSCNCDSEVGEEGLDASNVSADGVWSTEEREQADGYSLVSIHSRNGSNSLFNQPSVDSPHRRAPAERPLSPARDHTNTHLTPDKLCDLSLELKHTRCTSNALPLPWQNAQQGVPSSSCRQTEPLFAANANRRELSNAQSTELPLTAPTAQSGCQLKYDPLNVIPENPAHTQVHNHVEAKAKTSLSAQGGTSTDSLSYTMDPLSMSLLQVDQQVATASFLQAEQVDTRSLEIERGKNKGKEEEEECLTCAKIAGKVVEDIEFHLSFLELPRANTHCPPTPDTVTAANHSEQRKDVCFATYKHCGIGMMKPPISGVMLGSLLDQDYSQKPQITPATEVLNNKDPATHLKSSSCVSVETPLMQSISSPVQHSQNPMTNGATQMPPESAHEVHNKLAFPISTPQSLQPNVPTESNSEKKTSNLQIRPVVHLSTLEDVYHTQWHVVQAHWEQLEEMETLCRKDGRLLGQQPDMAFGEYVHKLREIMERKARCVHSMIAQLQPYLKTNYSNQPHNQGEDKDDQITSIN